MTFPLSESEFPRTRIESADALWKMRTRSFTTLAVSRVKATLPSLSRLKRVKNIYMFTNPSCG